MLISHVSLVHSLLSQGSGAGPGGVVSATRLVYGKAGIKPGLCQQEVCLQRQSLSYHSQLFVATLLSAATGSPTHRLSGGPLFLVPPPDIPLALSTPASGGHCHYGY